MPQGARSPSVAGLLSLLVPGLGQLYNGERRKGLAAFCVCTVTGIVGVAATLVIPHRPWNYVVPLAVILAVVVYFVVNAVQTARRPPPESEPPPPPLPSRHVAVAVIAAFAVAVAWRWAVGEFWLEGFRIPSSSMEPTIVPGDHVLADKLRPRLSALERNAVVVFRHPWDDILFVQRIVALPGERVGIDGKQLVIDGRPLEEPHAKKPEWAQSFGPVRVPRRGDVVEIRGDRGLYVNGEPALIPQGPFQPFRATHVGPSKTGFDVFYGRLFPAGTTLDRPSGPFPVEEDWYFVMGDNRGSSRDSRFWGFVPRSRVVGAVVEIYWSQDDRGSVRWDRIGEPVR